MPVRAQWVNVGVDADGGPAWGFALGDYDPSRPLVVDPLLYGTYLGGGASGVALDAGGRAVVVGNTGSADFNFGGAPGFDQSHNGGSSDTFAVRLNAAGTALEYSTFLGGADEDYATGVAVDAGGRAVVVGYTKSPAFGFGGAPGFDQSHNGYIDAFAVRLNAAGTALEYGTFLGTSGQDEAHGVAVDTGGRATVVGLAGDSGDFSFGGAPGFDQSFNGYFDAFVVRLNIAGTGLEYGTFLGGSGYEWANGVSVDGAGRAVVVGRASFSADFNFGGAPGFDQSFNGPGNFNPGDGFAVRLNAAGTGLEYGTFLGGSGLDEALGVAVDAGGRAVVVGTTSSSDFGFGGAPGFDQSFNGGFYDAFAVRLNAAGTGLDYGTFLGGSIGFQCRYCAAVGDYATGAAIDASGRAVVVGWSLSPDFNFGTAPGFDQSFNGTGFGVGDAFAVRLNVAGTALEYGTFLGGSGGDAASSVAVDASGRAVVVGSTGSADFSFGGAPGFDQSFNGGGNAFVVKDDLFAAFCVPRPRVQPRPAVNGGRLVVIVQATPLATGQANALRWLEFGLFQNARVTMGGQPIASGQVVPIPNGAVETTFAVERVAVSQATTVHLTVVDGCGAWPTFVGGGVNAGF